MEFSFPTDGNKVFRQSGGGMMKTQNGKNGATNKTSLTLANLIQKGHLLALVALSLAACQNKPNALNEALAKGEIISLDTEDATQNNGIIGGVPVDSGDTILSSTVGLYDPLFKRAFCTGTLLTKNIVVTAAHCLTGSSPSKVLVGFGKDVGPTKVQFRKVDGGRIHSTFLRLTKAQANDPRSANWGDVGVIRFVGTIPAGFAPAMILNNSAELKNGQDVTLAGFGYIDGYKRLSSTNLMKTTVQIKDAKFSATEVEIAPSAGHGACHGDSGGPAFVNLNGRDIVFGATSRTATMSGAVSCLEGSIYTVLAAHLDWLKESIKILNPTNSNGTSNNVSSPTPIQTPIVSMNP